VETRLMMKYREGQWTGASYVWDREGAEAQLVADSEALTATFGGVEWHYPSRRACLDCHNSDRSLGLEAAQLDLVRVYPETGRTANQLQTWQRMGLVEGPIPDGPRLPRDGEEGSLEARARAYLHVNCAVCHTRNGPTPVDMDLRFGTLVGDMRVCEVLAKEGDLGIPDARRLYPGTPQLSIISRRMHLTGPGRMPPLGPQLVDEEGVALIDAWISSLGGCP
jgi:mono/diheme cytochrome c family protein